MTPRQAETLNFIRSYKADHGCSPSYDDIRVELGLGSKSGVHRLVTSLRDQGHISINRGHARSIEIISLTHEGHIREQVYGAFKVFYANGMALPSTSELAAFLGFGSGHS